MSMERYWGLIFGVGSVLLTAMSVLAQPAQLEAPSIGRVTSVLREATVTRADSREVLRVKLNGSVFFKDIYETQVGAQVRMLLDNDSVLSLGENTRLQITEHLYDPTQNQTVIELLNGMLRSLVGKLIAQGGRFEIHTPTAVAAVRGTYFVVWVLPEEGGKQVTRVANIGQEGAVEVRNAQSDVAGTTMLGPLQSTFVEAGRPPAPPTPIDPSLLIDLIEGTDIRDQVITEIPARLEMPGIDVSDELVTPMSVPAVAGARGIGGAPGRGSGEEPPIHIPIPPILQPPVTGTTPVADSTPVTVNVLFP